LRRLLGVTTSLVYRGGKPRKEYRYGSVFSKPNLELTKKQRYSDKCFATDDTGNGPVLEFQASPGRHVFQVVLVVDSDQIFVERLASDSIPPHLVQLALDRPGQSASESLLQNINVTLDLFFCRGFKKNPEFTKSVKLTVREVR
jgi:hypothetical protein